MKPFVPSDFVARHRLDTYAVALVTGDDVRDWQLTFKTLVLFPYDKASANCIQVDESAWRDHFWLYRVALRNRKDFGNYIEERGLRWIDHSMFFPARFRANTVVSFAVVATHNHFVLDRGGKVFNRHAPIITLPAEAVEDQYLSLLGLLNSSTACFWMKQVFHDKGGGGIGGGLATELWEHFYEFTGTGLHQFPLPDVKPISLARQLDRLGQSYVRLLPDAIVQAVTPTNGRLFEARREAEAIHRLMFSKQEELDWHCYHLYNLLADDLRFTGDDVPEITLGQRAFEIVMARQMAKGELQTTWFERHGSTPITELPKHWPAAYRKLVERPNQGDRIKQRDRSDRTA